MTRKREAESRLLDDLVQLARRETPPPVEWSRLESQLRKAAALDARPAPARVRLRPAPIWALAAAAVLTAAVVLFVQTRPGAPLREQGPRMAADEPASASIRGARTSPPQEIVALTAPRRVQHPLVGAWTLATGGKAVVIGDQPVTVRLMEGALTAEVVPSAKDESFVVVAANVRVAVHGTRFRVRWGPAEDSVHVEVYEGVVGVRPAGDPQASEVRLRAPTAARFDRAGAPMGADPAPLPLRKRIGHPSKSAATLPSSESRPSSPDLAEGSARAAQVVQRCFDEHTATNEETQVSLTTRLVARINPDGQVHSAEFQPPLAPAVERCVSRAFSTVRFPESTEGALLDEELTVRR